MIAAGFQDVPIIALTMNRKLHEQPGNDLNYLKYVPKPCWLACTRMPSPRCTTPRPSERSTGERLWRWRTSCSSHWIAGSCRWNGDRCSPGCKMRWRRFNDIPTLDRPYPKVGIVGEIYVKYNSFSNNHVAQWLMEQGIEVVVPDFLTFFLAWFVSTNVRVKENMARRDIAWLIYNLLEGRVPGAAGPGRSDHERASSITGPPHDPGYRPRGREGRQPDALLRRELADRRRDRHDGGERDTERDLPATVRLHRQPGHGARGLRSA